jgi:hypothetical protein
MRVGEGVWLLILGFALGLIPIWYKSKKTLATHVKAMRAELRISEHLADTYLKEPIAAPLYRFPSWAFESGYQEILAEIEISEVHARDISVYFHKVLEMNRGLDRADRLRDLDPDEREVTPGSPLHWEMVRLRGKAAELLEREIPKARDAVEYAARSLASFL